MTHAPTATNRADAAIFVDARHALDMRPAVPGTVRVYVDHGLVTLTGTVRLPFERMEAEEAVRYIPGVRRLVNDILVTEVSNAAGYEPPDDRS